MRKPNSNSRLKTLPEGMQDTIFEWCSSDSLESAVARCKAELLDPKTGQPLLTNRDSMSDFFKWYPDAALYRNAQKRSLRAEELLKKVDPAASAEKLRAFGQLVFTDLAIEARNPEAFVGMVGEERKNRELDAKIAGFKLKYEQKERELALADKKYRRETCETFIKWQENEIARQIVAGPGTNSQKIEALGKAMFGSDWE